MPERRYVSDRTWFTTFDYPLLSGDVSARVECRVTVEGKRKNPGRQAGIGLRMSGAAHFRLWVDWADGKGPIHMKTDSVNSLTTFNYHLAADVPDHVKRGTVVTAYLEIVEGQV